MLLSKILWENFLLLWVDMEEFERGKSKIIIFNSRVLYILNGAMTVSLNENDEGSEKKKSSEEMCKELGWRKEY